MPNDKGNTSVFVAVRPGSPASLRLANLARGKINFDLDGREATIQSVTHRNPRARGTGLFATGWDVKVQVPFELTGEASADYINQIATQAVEQYVFKK